MHKPMMISLVMVTLLSGCDVATSVSVRSTERLHKSALKSTQAKQLLPRKTDGSSADRTAGEAEEKTGETKAGATTPDEASASREREASAATAATGATGTGPTLLRPATALTTETKLVPVEGDDGAVASMMFLGGASKLSWSVESTQSGQALAVARIRLVLQTNAYYPLPVLPGFDVPASEAIEPDEAASDEAIASEGAATFSPFPETDVAFELGDATTLEKAPAEISWPATFQPGATSTLTYELNNKDVLQFLNANPGTASFTFEATLLDAAGNAIKNELDQTFSLKHTVQVL